MPITLNGTTGVVTPGATVGSITGVLKATSGVVAQAVAGSDYGQLTLATAQTATGTSVDFTSIPSWAKRITVIVNGLSTNGTSPTQIQIGDSGGIQTTGYNITLASIQPTTTSLQTYTSGIVFPGTDAIHSRYATISMININSNIWIITGSGFDDTTNTTGIINGVKSLTSTLDRLRITTINGTNTFDAGTINISYE
jgi:hypothetical protein